MYFNTGDHNDDDDDEKEEEDDDDDEYDTFEGLNEKISSMALSSS